MNLKAFHIVFVTCSSLLAFVFGGWSLARGGGTYVALGLMSLLIGIALVVYGFWFWRKITTPQEEHARRRKLFRSVQAALIAIWLGSTEQIAWACSVCYGEAEGPLIEAARAGIFLLYGMVALVQIAFVGFFITLYRRAKRHHRAERLAGLHTPQYLHRTD